MLVVLAAFILAIVAILLSIFLLLALLALLLKHLTVKKEFWLDLKKEEITHLEEFLEKAVELHKESGIEEMDYSIGLFRVSILKLRSSYNDEALDYKSWVNNFAVAASLQWLRHTPKSYRMLPLKF